jgi:hypothetical protein
MRPDIRTVLARADRRWALANAADPILADHLDALTEAADTYLGTEAVVAVRAELATTKALLGRLVKVLVGSWDPKGDVPVQAAEAGRVLRQVEQYLLSLHDDQKGAA